ncbi:4'-phosphopantetheinyl transferase family protein [Andreprevotia chitinilytica]|uniref:4'-phosphopantetheinyl transferase family protein n=1 Tax=Andreprevotia chitinilytica TaxID=396808 RepID=UPI0006910078|nr:4'-phosphopantetheinyl transferase superfamily protein [Andreprevotia chitinilytica]
MQFTLALPPIEEMVWQDHLFVMPIAEYFSEAMLDLLTPDEKARAGRFIPAPARQQYIATHWLKGAILSRYTGVPAPALRYAQNSYGKPHLADTGCGIHFNISHADGYAAVMISTRHEVGVDIEVPRQGVDLAGLADFTFHAGEIAAMQGKPVSVEALYRYWTLKEAATKALGLGLSLPFTDVLLQEGANQRYRYIDADAHTWALSHLRLASGAYLSFCAPGQETACKLLMLTKEREQGAFNTLPLSTQWLINDC